ncbi:MAG: aminotransferase class V-fold PLP-dependent enzyme [Anaerolineae bacterium]|nr:aminotransferase class V-fold PLP-dependent enzyme [Anaerolineae bacterium]
MNIETLAVHAGREVEGDTSAVTPSLTLSTTFERAEDGSFPSGHIYSRLSNPTRARWESALAQLEHGSRAFAFSSGQAAVAAMLQTLSAGDHVILPHDLYHGVRHLVKEILSRWGLSATFVDMREVDYVARAIQPNTRLVWLETPSNPALNIANIAQIAELAHAHGAFCGVDNTWASPIWQQPLVLGADVVMHSTTKYLGGHSDVLGGALIVREGKDDLVTRLLQIQQLSGAVQSPFDCWLLLRSLPTLPLRVRAQTANAELLAKFLHQHPRVEVVHYPGLPTHRGHDLAAEQMRGFGAMLSFQVKGSGTDAMNVAAKVKVFTRATSLGGMESLIEHRRSVEGADSPTPDALLRVSVGLEHADDLIADLAQALE